MTRAAAGFVKKPLERAADQLAVMAQETRVTEVSRAESGLFCPLDMSGVINTHVAEIFLVVAALVFEGESRWKFSDGYNTFPAEIEDEAFRARVMDGIERFGKGDGLLVRLRSVQKIVNGRLVTEQFIEEVLEHKAWEPGQGEIAGI